MNTVHYAVFLLGFFCHEGRQEQGNDIFPEAFQIICCESVAFKKQ